MTNEQRQALIAAYIRERAGYAQRGLTDKVAAIDTRLRELGDEATRPVQRAQRRTKKPT